MSRRRVRDLPDLMDTNEIDDYQYNVDIAFLPTEHKSSDSDRDSSSDEEEHISSQELPSGSYEHIKSSYNNTQKLLEPNRKYDWRDNEWEYNNLPDSEFDTFDPASILSLHSKNSLELFELFFSHSMKNHIIEATSENNFELTNDDLERFIVINMITIVNSRKRQSDYWSKKRLLQCPIIRDLMSREKFMKIKKFIRFYKLQEKDDNDKVWKIRYLFDLFRENCQKYGYFDFNLSMDEMMVKYFGRFSIKQCIRNKSIRFGIKLWALCSSDGYIYELDIYTGKSGKDDRNPLASVCLGSRVVIKLLQNLLATVNKEDLRQYHLFFDNFFTSPDLMVHLKKIGLAATGTVRQNRVKAKIDMPIKADRGTTISVHDENSKLNYITVMDSKPVSVLSTEYGDKPKVEMKRWHENTKQKIQFPQAFSKYNTHMGGVDLHDQHCNSLMPTIRSKKWTWCLFLRLIQASLANATVIYNKLHPDEKKGSKDIVEEVYEYYIEKFENAHRPKRQKIIHTSTEDHEIRIGVRKKCGMESCSVRTEHYCAKCRIYLCLDHRENHS